MFPLSKHYKSSGCLSRPALSVNSCKRWLAQCQGCVSSKVGAAVLPSFQSSNNEHRRYLLGDQSCQMAASQCFFFVNHVIRWYHAMQK